MVSERSLADSAALVTGASSGIGKATALALAREGADVGLLARREERLESLVSEMEAEYDVNALSLPTDVAEEGQVSAAIDETIEEFGRLDVVVSNAGVSAGEGLPLPEISLDDFDKVNGVNIGGAFYIARNAMDPLSETSGNLIFVGSFDGHYPRPDNPIYTASKWWLRGFAHSLSGEAGEQGIGITVVNPAKVRTEIGREGEPSFKEIYEEGEVLEPSDIAESIVFAASQNSRATVSELDLYTRDKFSREGF